MNKVLIIARYFGTRVPGLIKYLPEFRWQPLLLTTALPEDTRLPSGVTVVESGSRTESHFASAAGRSLFDRILALGGEIINYPDSCKSWKKPAVAAGRDVLESDKFDAIISSSSPVTGHLIARELKKKYRIPWIADLRDLWSQNHNYYYSSLRKMFDERLELKTLSSADVLVTVSQPWADRLGSLHIEKTVYAVTNGFDEDTVAENPAGLTSKFTVTYTGNIYRGKQNPVGLFDSLRSLISEDIIDPDDVEVRFYGPALDWLEKEISGYGLSGVVRQYGIVPQQVALEKQKESQLLWLMDWDDPAENGWYPLKIFEYLGAARPVLATGGVSGNVVHTLLAKTKGGLNAITMDEIKNSLRNYYNEFKLKGEISCHSLGDEIARYTQRKMTGKFVAILNGLLQR